MYLSANIDADAVCARTGADNVEQSGVVVQLVKRTILPGLSLQMEHFLRRGIDIDNMSVGVDCQHALFKRFQNIHTLTEQVGQVAGLKAEQFAFEVLSEAQREVNADRKRNDGNNEVLTERDEHLTVNFAQVDTGSDHADDMFTGHVIDGSIGTALHAGRRLAVGQNYAVAVLQMSEGIHGQTVFRCAGCAHDTVWIDDRNDIQPCQIVGRALEKGRKHLRGILSEQTPAGVIHICDDLRVGQKTLIERALFAL